MAAYPNVHLTTVEMPAGFMVPTVTGQQLSAPAAAGADSGLDGSTFSTALLASTSPTRALVSTAVLPAYSPFKDDAELDLPDGLQPASQVQQHEWVQHPGLDAAAAAVTAAAWPGDSQAMQPPAAVLAPWSTGGPTGDVTALGAATASADAIVDAMLITPSAMAADAVSPLQGWVGVGLAATDATSAAAAAAADASVQDSSVGLIMQQTPQSVEGELAELAAAAAVNLEAAAVAAAAVALPVAAAVETSTASAQSGDATWDAAQQQQEQQQAPEAAQQGHVEEVKQHRTHHHDSSSDDSSSDGECSSPRQKSAPAGGSGGPQAGGKSGGGKKKKQKKNKKGKKGKKG